MGVPPAQHKTTEPFELEEVDTVLEKPGSPPPTAGSNSPPEPLGHMAMASTPTVSARHSGQNQFFMTEDVQFIGVDAPNQVQGGPLHVHQEAIQPVAQATMTTGCGFRDGAVTYQRAIAGPSMQVSNVPVDNSNQVAGVQSPRLSLRCLDRNQSPAPSDSSGDSMIVHRDGSTLEQNRSDGKAARDSHRAASSNAQTIARPSRTASPKTRMLDNMSIWDSSDQLWDVGGYTTFGDHMEIPEIDLSDDDTLANV